MIEIKKIIEKEIMREIEIREKGDKINWDNEMNRDNNRNNIEIEIIR